MKLFGPMYERTLTWARHRNATWLLAFLSFIEAIFFPIPPDVMLAPMVLARPDRAFVYAGICTAASVIGGLLGYAIGFYLEPVGMWLLNLMGHPDGKAAFEKWFADWGLWVILIKGATPIPFKLLTITAGFIHMNFWTFLWASMASRAFSFMLVGILFKLFGAPIKAFIDKYLIWVTGAFVVAVVAGFLVIGALSGDGSAKEADKCSDATLESIGLDRN